MDVKPEDINPAIVKIGRENPAVKKIFAMYLAGVKVVDGEPLTWRQALELMVEKLGAQYSGALEGWKDSVVREEKTKQGEAPAPLMLADTGFTDPTARHVPPKPPNKWNLQVLEPASDFDPTLEVLVDEKSLETEVETLKRDLHLAKGVLSKFMSPIRAEFAAAGRAEEAPPIQISQSLAEQIARILSGGDTKSYVQAEECPECHHYAWFVEDGDRRCAVCDARKGKKKLIWEKQQLKSLLAEALQGQFNTRKLDKLEKLLTNEHREPV